MLWHGQCSLRMYHARASRCVYVIDPCGGNRSPWVVVQVFTKNVQLHTPGGLKKKAWQQHVWEHYVELHRTEPGFGNPAPVLSTPVDEEEEIDRVLDDCACSSRRPEDVSGEECGMGNDDRWDGLVALGCVGAVHKFGAWQARIGHCPNRPIRQPVVQDQVEPLQILSKVVVRVGARVRKGAGDGLIEAPGHDDGCVQLAALGRHDALDAAVDGVAGDDRQARKRRHKRGQTP